MGILCGEGFTEGKVGDDGHKDDEGATQGLAREDVGKLSTEVGAEPGPLGQGNRVLPG